MNPLDRLYAKMAKEDEVNPVAAMATKAVQATPKGECIKKTVRLTVPVQHQAEVIKIIKNRGIAIQQVIMWS